MLIYQPFGNCRGAYSNIDPNKTVEIVNCVYDHAAEGDGICCDSYTAVFFFRGKHGVKQHARIA